MLAILFAVAHVAITVSALAVWAKGSVQPEPSK
jgi:hypothetical protein